MRYSAFVQRVLRDDGLTRGLHDPEARLLVEWLVEQAELLSGARTEEDRGIAQLEGLYRRCRGIGRFVELWCHQRDLCGAAQLAAAENFAWPLPAPFEADACDLMNRLLVCEGGVMCPANR
jgi:hypothetical protein